MTSNNKQITPKLIPKYATGHFGPLNRLQTDVTKILVREAEQENMVFTQAAVNYLLEEIEDPEISEKYKTPETRDVLLRLLTVASEHTRSRSEFKTLLSFASIKRALKVFPCPKPWC